MSIVPSTFQMLLPPALHQHPVLGHPQLCLFPQQGQQGCQGVEGRPGISGPALEVSNYHPAPVISFFIFQGFQRENDLSLLHVYFKDVAMIKYNKDELFGWQVS